ncbi:MAG: 30S ribosomal protein S4 [Calditrichaeota bacterium]|nr:30S ribosomal protein S4 [Calditrichota bacterium]
MARYTDAKCKRCRAVGYKLHLKGERCLGPKCPLERKPYPPGQHGQSRRRKKSEYGLQLMEKQKVRWTYDLLEKQFRNTYEKANRMPGVTGENLLSMLERRLDMVVYRTGFMPSLPSARQLVRHRHITVDGRVVDIPSYITQPGEIIEVRERARKMEAIHTSLRRVKSANVLPHLELDKARLRVTLTAMPTREDIPETFNERAVVELYSK